MRPGTSFRQGSPRPAGHIFYIPAAERVTDDPKNRPHFLVKGCDQQTDPDGLATRAHISTEHPEYGCSYHEIHDPSALTTPEEEGSFVVAARLVPQVPDSLTHSRMSRTGEVRSVRRAVLLALAARDPGAEPVDGSIRGRLVRVTERKADFNYGVVLTADEYSAKRRYQVVVPILDRVVEGDDGLELLDPTRWDITTDPTPWWKALPCEQPMLIQRV